MMGWTTWNCHCCRSERAEYQWFLFSSTCAMISLSLYMRKVKLKTLAQNHMLGKSQQCRASSGESTPPSPLSSSSPPPLSPSSPVSSGGLYRWVGDRMCTLKTLLGYSDSYVEVYVGEPEWIPENYLGSCYNSPGRMTWWLQLEWHQGSCQEADSLGKYLGMKIDGTWYLMEVLHPWLLLPWLPWLHVIHAHNIQSFLFATRLQ